MPINRPVIGRYSGFNVRRSDEIDLDELRHRDYQAYEVEMYRRQEEENRHEQMRRAEQQALEQMQAEQNRLLQEEIDSHRAYEERYSFSAPTQSQSYYIPPESGSYSVSIPDGYEITSSTTINADSLRDSMAYMRLNSDPVRASYTNPRLTAEALIEQMHALFCVGLCNYCAGETREKVEELARKVV